MIALALVTGIAPSVWADEGERSIATAYELLERNRKRGDGPQMSG